MRTSRILVANEIQRISRSTPMELIILSEAGFLGLLVVAFIDYLICALTSRRRALADVLPYRPRSQSAGASPTKFEKAA
jgi:hypothetical protein